MNRKTSLMSNVWMQRAVIIGILLIIMAIFQRSFFSIQNWRGILMAIAITGIMSCGMLLVMLVGGVDLAMGSTAALTSVIAMNWYNNHGTTDGAFFVGVLLGVVVALVVGIVHGICDAYLKLPSFVVTLATSSLLYGLANVYLDGSFIHLANTTGMFYKIGNGRLFNIPMPIVIFAITAVIVGLICAKTTYGRRVYAVGSNREAAEIVGINSRMYRVTCYMICSVTACIGGCVLSSLSLVTSATTAQGYELSVMLALVVGGADIMGGYGDVGGAIFGALLAGIIDNMIVLLNIDTNYSKAVRGVVIVLAIAFNVYQNRKAAGLLAPKKKKKTA